MRDLDHYKLVGDANHRQVRTAVGSHEGFGPVIPHVQKHRAIGVRTAVGSHEGFGPLSLLVSTGVPAS